MKKRVLLIDMDPQANLSTMLGIKGPKFTVANVLLGRKSISEVTVNLDGLHIAPASNALPAIEAELFQQPNRNTLLKNALESVENYDYILIDNGAALGVLSLNSLTAANEVFVPIQSDYLALSGLARLRETVGGMRQGLNPDLAITGIICTMYDGRRNLSRDVLARVRTHFGDAVFDTLIRVCVAVAEAPARSQSISAYAPTSNGAADYQALCEEITEKELIGV